MATFPQPFPARFKVWQIFHTFTARALGQTFPKALIRSLGSTSIPFRQSFRNGALVPILRSHMRQTFLTWTRLDSLGISQSDSDLAGVEPFRGVRNFRTF